MNSSAEKKEKTTGENEAKGIYKKGYGTIAKKVMKDKNLNIISKAIYAYICSYAGKGKDAFPSQKLISNDLGINIGTLAKYTQELKDSGYITVKGHKEKGKFSKNLYTINIELNMVSPCTVKTDTETTEYGQIDTNNNNINNNIKTNNNSVNNNTLTKGKSKKNIEKTTEDKKEKLENAPVEIQQILKKYKELELPDFDYRPENYILLRAYGELGAVKLFDALTLMSQSEFVKNNMSINAIFKIENLKKALNGNFKNKVNNKKGTKTEFKKPVYEDFTGELIDEILSEKIGDIEDGKM